VAVEQRLGKQPIYDLAATIKDVAYDLGVEPGKPKKPSEKAIEDFKETYGARLKETYGIGPSQIKNVIYHAARDKELLKDIEHNPLIAVKNLLTKLKK